jgi:hypothetical protein
LSATAVRLRNGHLEAAKKARAKPASYRRRAPLLGGPCLGCDDLVDINVNVLFHLEPTVRLLTSAHQVLRATRMSTPYTNSDWLMRVRIMRGLLGTAFLLISTASFAADFIPPGDMSEPPGYGGPAYAPAYGGPAYGGPAYGGPIYGGPAYGGPIYHGPINYGPVYGGPIYGGPAYGGPAYGGPVYGGPAYGGPIYHGPINYGPVYGGPIYGGPVYGGGPFYVGPIYRGPMYGVMSPY